MTPSTPLPPTVRAAAIRLCDRGSQNVSLNSMVPIGDSVICCSRVTPISWLVCCTGIGMVRTDSSKMPNELRVQADTVGAPTLLLAGPALELVDRWTTELQILRRRSPSSDAVETLSTCVSELVEAIKAAKDARLHITISDVHASSRIPVSTLRWLCKHKPELLGAQKHEGVWYINRVKFERYMATSDREVAIARATEQLRKGNGVEAA